MIVENWGHDDLKKTYITRRRSPVEVGPTGNKGVIGWYVPQWMADEYPDITDWKNLNKYADLFKTSESGGKGQLLDGDPSFVTNDAALVANLKSGLQGGLFGQRGGVDQGGAAGDGAEEAAVVLLLRAAVAVRARRSTCG